MREHEVKRIVREEIRKAFKDSGIKLHESAPGRGDRVETPHGFGEVLSLQGPSVRVKLNGGSTININRSKVIVKN